MKVRKWLGTSTFKFSKFLKVNSQNLMFYRKMKTEIKVTNMEEMKYENMLCHNEVCYSIDRKRALMKLYLIMKSVECTRHRHRSYFMALKIIFTDDLKFFSFRLSDSVRLLKSSKAKVKIWFPTSKHTCLFKYPFIF